MSDNNAENNPQGQVPPGNVIRYTVPPEAMDRLFLIVPVPPVPPNERGIINLSCPVNTRIVLATLVDTFPGPALVYTTDQEAIVGSSTSVNGNNFAVPDSSTSSEVVNPNANFDPTLPAPAAATRVEPQQVSSSVPTTEPEFVTMQPVEHNSPEQSNLRDPLNISDASTLILDDRLPDEASLFGDATVSEELNVSDGVVAPEPVNSPAATGEPSNPQRHLVSDRKCLCQSCYSELVNYGFTEAHFIKRMIRVCKICKQTTLMKFYQDLCFPCSRRHNLCMRCVMFEINKNDFFDFDALLTDSDREK